MNGLIWTQCESQLLIIYFYLLLKRSKRWRFQDLNEKKLIERKGGHMFIQKNY